MHDIKMYLLSPVVIIYNNWNWKIGHFRNWFDAFIFPYATPIFHYSDCNERSTCL